MDPIIQPALTPEEWRSALASPMGVLYPAFASSSHRLAAVCLYGQPFGFTREDVALLNDVFEYFRPIEMGISGRDLSRLESLRERIAALLPPAESRYTVTVDSRPQQVVTEDRPWNTAPEEPA